MEKKEPLNFNMKLNDPRLINRLEQILIQEPNDNLSDEEIIQRKKDALNSLITIIKLDNTPDVEKIGILKVILKRLDDPVELIEVKETIENFISQNEDLIEGILQTGIDSNISPRQKADLQNIQIEVADYLEDLKNKQRKTRQNGGI